MKQDEIGLNASEAPVFEFRARYEYPEVAKLHVRIAVQTETRNELIETFEQFLRATGFVCDGRLEFVQEDE